MTKPFESICGGDIVDPYEILNEPFVKALFEGAQGFLLDIN
jgi:hypothetical protein